MEQDIILFHEEMKKEKKSAYFIMNPLITLYIFSLSYSI